MSPSSWALRHAVWKLPLPRAVRRGTGWGFCSPTPRTSFSRGKRSKKPSDTLALGESPVCPFAARGRAIPLGLGGCGWVLCLLSSIGRAPSSAPQTGVGFVSARYCRRRKAAWVRKISGCGKTALDAWHHKIGDFVRCRGRIYPARSVTVQCCSYGQYIQASQEALRRLAVCMKNCTCATVTEGREGPLP